MSKRPTVIISALDKSYGDNMSITIGIMNKSDILTSQRIKLLLEIIKQEGSQRSHTPQNPKEILVFEDIIN